MDDEMWVLFKEIKDEEDKQIKISNGIDDNCEENKLIKCDCGCVEFLIEDNMHICKKCCSIISKVIENTAEWRYYGNDDNRDGDPSRCGMPTNNLLPKSSIGSMIGSGYKDNIDMRIIRKFQMWNSMPYDERTLWNVFDKMTANTINNGIPMKVIDDAKNLYKQASSLKISRGDNKEGLIASCIYHACLVNDIPKSSKDIADMFNISHVTLNKGNTRFQTLLQLNVSSPSPIDFISQYGNNLNMSINDINKCKELVKLIEENEIMNDNSPTSSAAACKVSEVTIIKCYKLINAYHSFITTHKNNIFS